MLPRDPLEETPGPAMTGSGVDLTRVLTDISTGGSTGELVVRSPPGSARIHFVEGRVAWVFIADAKPHFALGLIRQSVVGREDIEQVVAECRRSGANFCETLIAWGLADREVLRTHLRADIQRALREIAAWPAPQGLFLPQPRRYESDLVFEVADVWPLYQPARAESAGYAVDESSSSPRARKDYDMQTVKAALDETMSIDGAIAAALVDYESGMSLGTAGGSDEFNIELAAAGNTEVVRAKARVASQLGLPGGIEDILITLSTQYHLIRPLRNQPGLFFYLALDRSKSNLAMARFRLTQIEATVQI